MSAFSSIHKFVRTLVAAHAKNWDNTINIALSEFTEQTGENLIGLSAIKLDENDSVLEEFSLFDDMIKRRKFLEFKNRPITNLEKHFITGQI